MSEAVLVTAPVLALATSLADSMECFTVNRLREQTRFGKPIALAFCGHFAKKDGCFTHATDVFAGKLFGDSDAVIFDRRTVSFETNLNQTVFYECRIDLLTYVFAHALLANVHVRLEPLPDATKFFFLRAAKWC